VSVPQRAVGIDELPSIGAAVVTMGVFDGVHLGHRAILAATRELAAEQGIAGVALVFDPPPDEVLRPGNRVPRLAPLAVNLERIEALGVTAAIPVRFDERVRDLTAEGFLDALAPGITIGGLAMSVRSAFGRRVGWLRAVDGVSLQVHPGETLGLVGESGCGKSTLGKTVMGIYTPTAGEIRFAGREIGRLPRRARRAVAKHLQYVYQDPGASLDPRWKIRPGS